MTDLNSSHTTTLAPWCSPIGDRRPARPAYRPLLRQEGVALTSKDELPHLIDGFHEVVVGTCGV